MVRHLCAGGDVLPCGVRSAAARVARPSARGQHEAGGRAGRARVPARVPAGDRCRARRVAQGPAFDCGGLAAEAARGRSARRVGLLDPDTTLTADAGDAVLPAAARIEPVVPAAFRAARLHAAFPDRAWAAFGAAAPSCSSAGFGSRRTHPFAMADASRHRRRRYGGGARRGVLPAAAEQRSDGRRRAFEDPVLDRHQSLRGSAEALSQYERVKEGRSARRRSEARRPACGRRQRLGAHKGWQRRGSTRTIHQGSCRRAGRCRRQGAARRS